MIQYDNRVTAKTLALSLGETDEYEYLTGEKKIFSDDRRMKFDKVYIFSPQKRV